MRLLGIMLLLLSCKTVRPEAESGPATVAAVPAAPVLWPYRLEVTLQGSGGMPGVMPDEVRMRAWFVSGRQLPGRRTFFPVPGDPGRGLVETGSQTGPEPESGYRRIISRLSHTEPVEFYFHMPGFELAFDRYDSDGELQCSTRWRFSEEQSAALDLCGGGGQIIGLRFSRGEYLPAIPFPPGTEAGFRVYGIFAEDHPVESGLERETVVSVELEVLSSASASGRLHTGMACSVIVEADRLLESAGDYTLWRDQQKFALDYQAHGVFSFRLPPGRPAQEASLRLYDLKCGAGSDPVEQGP